MVLCEHCRAEIGASEADARFPFAAYGLAGGAVGALVAAATGALVLIPAGLIAGALAGAHTCEGCGAEVPEGEPSYHLMEATEDAAGAPTFSPARVGKDRAPATEGAAFDSGQSARPQQMPRQAALNLPRRSELESPWENPGAPPAEKPTSYKYDLLTKGLVPVEPAGQTGFPDITSTISIGPGFDIGNAQIIGPMAPISPPADALDPFAPEPNIVSPSLPEWGFPPIEGGIQ